MFRKIEDFFSNNMGKFLIKKNSHNLQINQIEKRLLKEFALKKINYAEKTYIPNHYTIILAEVDYQNLNFLATYQRLYRFIVQAAIKYDFYINNHLLIQLTSDIIKEKGSFTIQSLSDSQVFDEDKAATEENELNHTIVFQKGFVTKAFIDYSKLTFSTLTVIVGPDKNFMINLGKKRVHIGRRENNEIVLQDANCSRLHAYITFENYRHIIYDANSLNGTYVNNNIIHKYQLNFGDKITIGNTVILYDISKLT